MNLLGYLSVQLFVFFTWKVALPLQITFKESVHRDLGKNNTNLECSFKKESSSEEIVSLVFLVPNGTSPDFVQIVRFRPNKTSVYLPAGRYLKNRSTISNLTLTTATLIFQPLECSDETQYQCLTTFFNADQEQIAKAETRHLIVTANPSAPEIVWDKSSLKEGDNMTLSCDGNVGKPSRSFIWTRGKDSSIYQYKNVSTEFTKTPNSCTYDGISNLTIELTDEDDKSEIRCSIGEHNASTTLDVKYRVRKPNITREPEEDEYLQGSNQIQLICAGRGNPQPSYSWFKDGNELLSNSNVLNITEVLTNNSGIYVCNASNTVFGTEYTESTIVNISIVTELQTTTTISTSTTTTTPTSGSGSQKDDNKALSDIAIVGIAVGVAVLVIIFVAIACIAYQRKRATNTKKYQQEGSEKTIRNVGGYNSVHLEHGTGFRGPGKEPQNHNNMAYNPDDNEKTRESMNKENDSLGPDEKYEYASVDEATKLKNRTIDRTREEKEQSSNQDEIEDPYVESKENTYAHLNQKQKHKSDVNADLYAKTGSVTNRL